MDTFYMPGEWEKHEATWLAWPHDRITFPVNFEKIEKTFIEIIKALHADEKVRLLVLDEKTQAHVVSLAHEAGIDTTRIEFYITRYADTWTRDYVPLFVKNAKTGEPSCVKWNYNAYGEKFPDLLKDNEVFMSLAGKLSMPMVKSDIVMEGGSIELNGAGILVTTKQCLLNPNRNPKLSQEQIEGYLKQYTGVEKIIWLGDGIINDHTDGHVDDLVKFTDSNTLVCAFEDDLTDPNFKTLNNNYKILEEARDMNSMPFKLVKIPMPHMNYDTGERAPASYANFYIGNKTVLVPTYNDPNDAKALEVISSLFTDRKTVGIDCSDLIYGGGSIHCITQQQIS